MLREYWLNRLALTCGVLGVLAIFSFSVLTDPSELSIGKIGERELGSRVSVHGIVTWRLETNKTLLFLLDDGNSIKVVKFNAGEEDREKVKEDRFLKITGTVQRYRGELEIIAEGIGND